jgi:hypothetical protein
MGPGRGPWLAVFPWNRETTDRRFPAMPSPVSFVSSTRGRTARSIAISLGLLLMGVLAAPASALDIQVDLLGDPPPNGCTPGHCSLREAVSLANSLAGPDRILLPATPGLPLQLSLAGSNEDANANGDLDVLDDLEIVGAGREATVLVQTVGERVLHTLMARTQRLTLRALTVQGGSSDLGGGLQSTSLLLIEDVAFVGNSSSFAGGALQFTAQFAPEITEPRVVMRRVRFENNVATRQANDASGGALHVTSFIDNLPILLIEDGEFINNRAQSNGGAILLSGSINWYGGGVSVQRTTFSDNVTGSFGGAAIAATSSSFDIEIADSLLDGNVASGGTLAGGAINLERARSIALLRTTLSSNSGPRGGALRANASARIVDSHLFDNTASEGGGAVWATGELRVEHSTFESNRVTSTDAADPGGGAIGFTGSTAQIQRSTFSGNDAFRGGAISIVTGSLQLLGSTIVAPAFGLSGRLGTALRVLDDDNADALTFINSLISGTCTFASGARQLAVALNNIEATASTCRLGTASVTASNQINVPNAQLALGPLANNGGPTPTRMPGAGSVAIDQGREANCSPTDQRHFVRGDALCDIGAVEVSAVPATVEVFRNGFE